MIITGKNLTIEDVVKVARYNEKIEISQEAITRINKNRAIVEEKIKNKEVMYGVTTGVGELVDIVLSSEQLKDFQRYLIYSHAAGYGKFLPIEVVRAAMLSRINVLCIGHSGVRPIVVETLKEMLNKGVTPVVCEKGSVGASGDLCLMAQIALVLIGEGEAFYKGNKYSGNEAMRMAGIPTIELEARDGLALINGCNVITGMGCIELFDADKIIKQSEIAGAMTLEVLNANMTAYDERLHKARGYPGAIICAENIRRIVEDSELLKQSGKKVQDAYSLRSIPQTVGAAKDILKFVKEIFTIELNGVSDNPLFFDDGVCLSGANFQSTHIALGLEALGMAITTICVISERRLNRMLNSDLSMGLPPFLIEGAGMFSGLMSIQYIADSLVCENRVLTTPAVVGSIPAVADQEDFVSMGMNTAIKTRQIIENAAAIIGIEFIAATQAIDLRKLKPGRGTKAAYEIIRKYVKFLDKDRPLHNEINKLAEVVKSGEILSAVEEEIGKLK